MSMMACVLCYGYVDTDFDPDSLYVREQDGKCICGGCREREELSTIFDEEEAAA
jgi:hypothetical protein